MQVILDARPLQSASGGRGIGRYVRELARHLPGVDGVEEVRLLLDGRRPDPRELPEADGLRPVVMDRPPGPQFIIDRLRRIPESVVRGADVFHSTYLPPPRLPAAVATVMTVHDLTPLQFPRAVPRRAGIVFRVAFAGARRCDRVLVPSQSTAGAVRRLLGIPSERIRVTPLGVDAELFDGREDGIEPPFEGRYLLHVGGFDPTKNLGLLLEVMTRLRDLSSCEDLRLVVVGDGGGRSADFRREIAARGLERRVVLPGRLEDAALARAYAGAELFLFPSLAEGFGLPPLEAQAAGCPVLAAAASSLPEVVGKGGRLLPPDDPEGWARTVGELLEQPGERRRMGEAGREHARRFSWTATARATVRAYREARDAS